MSTPDLPPPALDPRRILLATDLSGRCDRALERAIDFTRRCNARLIAVHALEQVPDVIGARARKDRFWHVREDRVAAVSRQLQADIHDDGVAASVVVEEGDPAEVVLQVAKKEAAELILTGLARAEPFGRLLLGATVERLVRQADAPVLVVKNRVRGPYRHVVVATDFSASSAQALATAADWFGDSRLTLFHACEPSLSRLASDKQSKLARVRAARAEADRFVAEASISDQARRNLTVLIEHGGPEGILREYVEHQDVELVVLGRRGRNAVLDLLLGSTADALLHQLPCDVMIVRDPGAGVADQG